MPEKQNDSIGALWLNESKNGNKYMSGSIEIDGATHKIIVFKNNHKKKETHPDYRILPKDDNGGGSQRRTKEGYAVQQGSPAQQTMDDDIPFDVPDF